MDFESSLEEILEDYSFYKNKLLNKKYLFIFSEVRNRQLSKISNKKKLENLKIIKIEFKDSFFPHAVGIKPYGMNASKLVEKINERTIEIKDYEATSFRPLKRKALKDLPNALTKPMIIGDYAGYKPDFKADKILGSPSHINGAIVGILVSTEITRDKIIECIPNSLQHEIAGNYVISDTERKILFTLEKEIEQEKYSKLLFKAKDIPIHNLYYNESIKKHLSPELQEEIRKQVENYNCLTGCIIGNIESKHIENRWIIKEDVERLNIEKKDNAKEVIVKVGGLEDKKLYGASVSYYNISDLQITKEIEQKFVPIKQKEQEKTVEKVREKRVGIGD